MKICTNCILPETYPGIRFSEDGVCNFCARQQEPDALAANRDRYRSKFEELLKQTRDTGSYDCLMCYSGGKDSTYTLDLLRNHYDMKILAFTLDNGFLSPVAEGNIKKVVENLDVDHISFKPRFDLLKRIFSKAAEEVFYPEKSLERASTICTSCISFVKFPALKMALEKNIPFMGYGWSPGQAPVQSSVMKTNPSLIRVTQDTVLKPLAERFGEEITPYFLEEKHFEDPERFPHNIHPLAFLDYDEDAIIQRISELGWEEPDDTDPNSTNCLLNAFANHVHEDQFGYNPYMFEIANMVRAGIVAREEGIKKFQEHPPSEYVENIRKILRT